jgi:hypothetical protein
MENLPQVQKRELPKLQDLLNADVLKLDEINQLNILLNQQPPENWLKVNPMVPKLKYLPIERVEYLLTRLFFQWKVEVKHVQLIGNSVCCEVRLHYFNPVLDCWEWQDGVGASPLQTDSGKGAIEFNYLKSGSVMMAAPAAKSYAVKDAAEQIGAIFGKNLNRADKANYDTLADNPAFNARDKKLEDKLND